MPILPAEPEWYPETFWESDLVEDKQDRLWWCLHTKPRQEKMLARSLRARGVAHYLPQVTQETRTPGGRRICSTVPLFPGYLFLYGDDHDRGEAIQGNHLANMLEIWDQDGVERDLRRVHRMLSVGMAITPEPTYLVGDLVRILSGPLRGLVGTVTRRDGRDRFVAVVQFLGRGAAVDLQDWQVEPAEDDSPGCVNQSRGIEPTTRFRRASSTLASV
ncbi:transcriptional antiterminator RfaH [Singulisphaera sp. GP187]|uniref:transcription termination/antitermination protein NusG n=1 Tax=Singulisphaera sp. GP187 TaxID=1882752 RepID=UPI00092AF75B|nr:transcription termination/antitermination NusG family protein [Singulisphaera sp. GP187]SIO61519.1 transcriptional antiterminator RfaH [Singulisphaera sp. GP187]